VLAIRRLLTVPLLSSDDAVVVVYMSVIDERIEHGCLSAAAREDDVWPITQYFTSESVATYTRSRSIVRNA